jgi:hypothetical protein
MDIPSKTQKDAGGPCPCEGRRVPADLNRESADQFHDLADLHHEQNC